MGSIYTSIGYLWTYHLAPLVSSTIKWGVCLGFCLPRPESLSHICSDISRHGWKVCSSPLLGLLVTSTLTCVAGPHPQESWIHLLCWVWATSPGPWLRGPPTWNHSHKACPPPGLPLPSSPTLTPSIFLSLLPSASLLPILSLASPSAHLLPLQGNRNAEAFMGAVDYCFLMLGPWKVT